MEPIASASSTMALAGIENLSIEDRELDRTDAVSTVSSSRTSSPDGISTPSSSADLLELYGSACTSSSVPSTPLSSLGSGASDGDGDACIQPLALPPSVVAPARKDGGTASILAFAASIVRREAEAVARLSERLATEGTRSAIEFEKCVDLLRATYAREGKAVFVGLGKSAIVGRKASATFNSLGLPAATLDPVAALHGDMGMLSPRDCVLLISNSGATRELQRLTAVLKATSTPLVGSFIAVTSSPDAPLASHSNAWLDADVAALPTDDFGEADPTTPAPTSSVAVAASALDALGLVLFRQNVGWNEPVQSRALAFAKCHSAGQLGLKLLGDHAAPM